LFPCFILRSNHSKEVLPEEQADQASWDVWFTDNDETFQNIRARYEQEGREEDDSDRIIFDKDGGCDSDYEDDE
jgi:hypothetical protein